MFLFLFEALGVLENIGFVANMVSMVLYFHFMMKLDLPTSSNTLTNFLGSVCLLTLLGGFISDAYLNRLYTILIFGSLEVIVSFTISKCTPSFYINSSTSYA